MKHLAISFLLACSVMAQDRPVFPLWPAGAPGALGERDQDKPTLTVYLPEKEKATGAAMVICPGGGYGGLAGHEGGDYALYLNQQGLTCFSGHTWEDKAVKIENTLEFAAALQRHNVPFDLHVYQKGNHGIGLASKPPFENPHPWAKDLVFWLKVQGFVR